MRRVLLALVTTVTGLVMLLSFKTSTVIASAAGAATAVPSTATSTVTGGSTSSSGSSLSTTPAATTKIVTGNSVDTRWGPVQVKITVTNGKLTSAVAVVYPTSNGRDQQINSYAVPMLEKETLQAGSAKIDMVSGATYTSNGYITSLQSALDKV